MNTDLKQVDNKPARKGFIGFQMSVPYDIYLFINTYGPCKEGVDFLLKHNSLEEAWQKCDKPAWLLWGFKKFFGKSLTEIEDKTIVNARFGNWSCDEIRENLKPDFSVVTSMGAREC